MGKRNGTVGALAPWYGAKRNMADLIVHQLGPHDSYWEPFCGSMAVLLAKPPSRCESVNDLHADLTNLAWILQDEALASQLFFRLQRTLCAEGLQVEAVRQLQDSPPPTWNHPPIYRLTRAYWWFMASWLSLNGNSGTRKLTGNFAARYSAVGGQPGQRFCAAVNTIPEWFQRLRFVQILQRDGFEVLSKIEDRSGTVIYCDPPYLAKSQHYQHDFTSADHDRLAEALNSFRRTRVVLSYYADDRLAKLYPKWNVLQCQRNRAMSNPTSKANGVRSAPEVLLLNGPTIPEVPNG